MLHQRKKPLKNVWEEEALFGSDQKKLVSLTIKKEQNIYLSICLLPVEKVTNSSLQLVHFDVCRSPASQNVALTLARLMECFPNSLDLGKERLRKKKTLKCLELGGLFKGDWKNDTKQNKTVCLLLYLFLTARWESQRLSQPNVGASRNVRRAPKPCGKQ